MNNENYSIFNSKNKLLCFSDEDFSASQLVFSDEGLFEHYLIKESEENDEIFAIDIHGINHTLFGPANGAVVCVTTPSSSTCNLEKLIALWKNAGFESPAVVNVDNFESDKTAHHISKTFLTQLGTVLFQVSNDAVKLDKQIALLREDLEDYRRNIHEMKVENRLLGNYPSLTFDRSPSNSSINIESLRINQLLPYSGSMISAIAFHVPDYMESHDGTFIVSLIAREDSSVIASWRVSSVNMKGPWVRLSLESRISTRYRFVDLSLEWDGFEEDSPRVSFTDAFGDEDGFVKLSSEQQPNQMLALQVWTGSQFNKESAGDHIYFPSEVSKHTNEILLRKIPMHIIKEVQGISEPEVEFEWLSTRENDILIHPIDSAPSEAKLSVRLSSKATGIYTRLTVEHEKSQPVSFQIFVIDNASNEVEQFLQSKDVTLDGIIYAGTWHSIVSMSEKPLTMMFDRECKDFTVIMKTKSDQNDSSFAHAWFCDLQVIL